MMKRSRWRSRLIAVTLAVATWLLVTVSAQSTPPFHQESHSLPQAAFSIQMMSDASEAERLLQQGIQYYRVSQFQAALQSWQQALEIYQAIGDRQGEAASLGNLGNAYISLGQYERAASFYQQALDLAREIGDRQGEANSLGNLGSVYFSLSQYQRAIDFQQQHLVIARDIGDRLGEASALTNLGLTYSTLSDYQRAVDQYQQALDIVRDNDFRQAFPIASRQIEADTLTNLGNVYFSLGDYQRAIDVQQQSLATAREMGNRQLEASVLGNLGNSYHALSDYQRAIDFHQQHLAISRDIGDRQGEANSLGNLGNTYSALGQYQRSIDFYQQSLGIKRDIGDRQGEANSLGNLGTTYRSLGQYERAVDSYQQSIVIADEIGDRGSKAASLGNLGIVYRVMGQYQQAIDFHQQSIVIARDIGNRQGEADSLGNLGLAYYALGQYQRAIDFYQQQLAIVRDIGDRQGEANALSNLGGAYDSVGQSQRAIASYQQSLDITRDIGDRGGEAKSLSNLGISLINTDQLAEAESVLAQSIEIFESLRTDLPDAQLIALADTQAATYTLLEQVLMAQGKTAEALETTERARARAFVLQLASRLSDREEFATLAGPETTALPAIADIQQIARDQNTTLVTYSLIFDQALYIWVVQPSGEIEFRSVEFDGSGSLPSPIAAIDGPVYRGSSDPSELDTLVAETRAGIGVVASLPSERLKDLHQVLIDPIVDLLPSDPDANVVFVPQGSLFLVPFAALQDVDDTYLIEKHTVLTAPSIQVFGLAAREEAQGRSSEFSDALVVGNPVMPQAWALGENGLEELQLAPLPGAEAEALAIADFLNISPLIGAQATEVQIKQQLPSAQLIHLATHGLLEYGDPQSSGVLDVPGALALTPGDGEDGLLTAAEILEMDLQAELAVLSACDTGRGRITGDGVVGLSRALITAGVPSVIVSLWAVPDAPTAALMAEFYRQLQQGQSKAQALRQAMLATLNDSPEPVNWAAFTLMGAIE